MLGKRLGLTVGIALASATSALAIPFNVTLNKPVTLSGTYGVLRPASGWAALPVAAAGSIDDGIFRPEGTLWNSDSIWWDAAVEGSEDNSITIDLLGPYAISGILTQADNNDNYRVDFLDPYSNTWFSLGAWGTALDAGLRTRPYGDHVTPFPLSFYASAFRLSALNGDGYYALSEFQAIGEPVPEPGTMALMAAGAAGLLARRRRRA